MPVLPTVLASSNSVRDLAALPLTIDGRAWFSELKLKVGAATNTEQSGETKAERIVHKSLVWAFLSALEF